MNDFFRSSSINELVKYRKIISMAIGNIGLYWLSKDFNKVIKTSETSVSTIASQKNEILPTISVPNLHKDDWNILSDNIKKEYGGNPEKNGWRSLPRGFVTFDTEKNKFYIIGGKWLNNNIAKIIANEFNLNNYSIYIIDHYDEIIWDSPY